MSYDPRRQEEEKQEFDNLQTAIDDLANELEELAKKIKPEELDNKVEEFKRQASQEDQK